MPVQRGTRVRRSRASGSAREAARGAATRSHDTVQQPVAARWPRANARAVGVGWMPADMQGCARRQKTRDAAPARGRPGACAERGRVRRAAAALDPSAGPEVEPLERVGLEVEEDSTGGPRAPSRARRARRVRRRTRARGGPGGALHQALPAARPTANAAVRRRLSPPPRAAAGATRARVRRARAAPCSARGLRRRPRATRRVQSSTLTDAAGRKRGAQWRRRRTRRPCSRSGQHRAVERAVAASRVYATSVAPAHERVVERREPGAQAANELVEAHAPAAKLSRHRADRRGRAHERAPPVAPRACSSPDGSSSTR